MMRNTRLRFAFALPACVLALLIHEMFFLVFLPVLLFSFLLDAESTRIAAETSQVPWHGGDPGICLPGHDAADGAPASADPEPGQCMEAGIARRVDFDLRGDVFDVMTRSLHDNTWKMAWVWGHDLGWKFLFFICASSSGSPSPCCCAPC